MFSLPVGEELAFFKGVRGNRDDWQLRLVYADWLEEQGRLDEAEFLRVSVQLRYPPRRHRPRPELRDRKKALTQALDSAWVLGVREVAPGTVTLVEEHAASIDVAGHPVLAHFTDMSWGRIPDLRGLWAAGQAVYVFLLGWSDGVEPHRVAIVRPPPDPDPWDVADQSHPPGTTATGDVVNVMTYGAYVRLTSGIVGLIFLGETKLKRRGRDGRRLWSVGDVVEVIVGPVEDEEQPLPLRMVGLPE